MCESSSFFLKSPAGSYLLILHSELKNKLISVNKIVLLFSPSCFSLPFFSSLFLSPFSFMLSLICFSHEFSLRAALFFFDSALPTSPWNIIPAIFLLSQEILNVLFYLQRTQSILNKEYMLREDSFSNDAVI